MGLRTWMEKQPGVVFEFFLIPILCFFENLNIFKILFLWIILRHHFLELVLFPGYLVTIKEYIF